MVISTLCPVIAQCRYAVLMQIQREMEGDAPEQASAEGARFYLWTILYIFIFLVRALDLNDTRSVLPGYRVIQEDNLGLGLPDHYI